MKILLIDASGTTGQAVDDNRDGAHTRPLQAELLDNVPAFVEVEEPENGIYPKAIEAILESLQVMQNSQALVTTHSPVVVAVTTAEICCAWI